MRPQLRSVEPLQSASSLTVPARGRSASALSARYMLRASAIVVGERRSNHSDSFLSVHSSRITGNFLTLISRERAKCSHFCQFSYIESHRPLRTSRCYSQPRARLKTAHVARCIAFISMAITACLSIFQISNKEYLQ